MPALPVIPAMGLLEQWQQVRQRSLTLTAQLSAEDCQAQSMPDASPVKWHLAHTTWFLETFILEAREPGFIPFDPAFRILFNSYYNGIGEKHPRAQRGLLTRPGLEQVLAYRRHVDAHIEQLWETDGSALLAGLLQLGMQHEQQHQELMLTDLKHLFSCNATFATQSPQKSLQEFPSGNLSTVPRQPTERQWQAFDAGLVDVGHTGADFCFDNETPRHRQFVESFEFATRLVSNGDYLAFIEAGGYQDATLWLAQGWDWLGNGRDGDRIMHPLYWKKNTAQQWQEFTLDGMHNLDSQQPVCHLNYFEAAAYAHWAGARLPTEAEWEWAGQRFAAQRFAGQHFAAQRFAGQHFAAQRFTDQHSAGQHSAGQHPTAQRHDLQQMYGHCWQWTSSSYAPYPGFATPEGAIGEYNGKFMVNQYVLRGSSCFTPPGHARLTYRNFFPTTARWQMTGIRLARSLITAAP